ncbi:plasminogen activator sPA [Sarcoptes scabiei]|uniref:Ubiquitin-conjugating enzyme E2 Q2-like protein n=1 Tax=Sarcoptes scabiei TaxID=52283 RepID=A0A132AIM4_SARSC|nr:ubiquitin-conjugating enzyme E2 Q2-like protein [Sarcoptes scabiei]UXI16283.1 plasminogen activator sPA [Sarcoptes scabiei]
MACLARLKHDVKILVELFHKNHPTLRVIYASVDEISFVFVENRKVTITNPTSSSSETNEDQSIQDDITERKYPINANITETYPQDPPVWFADSDEISSTLEKLISTTDSDNFILRQVAILIEHLCDHFSIPKPSNDLTRLYYLSQSPYMSLAMIDARIAANKASSSTDFVSNQLDSEQIPSNDSTLINNHQTIISSSSNSSSIISSDSPKNNNNNDSDSEIGYQYSCDSNHSISSTCVESSNNEASNESDQNKKIKSHHSDSESDVEDNNDDDLQSNEEDEDDDVDMHIEMADDTTSEQNDTDGISSDNLARLEQIRQCQQHQFFQNRNTSSLQATDRLMKELREVYRCDSYKRKVFEVHLVNESLYEWNVHLKKVDPDSQLQADLLALKEKDGHDYITLNITFKENYPFEPPFIRVAYPYINGGYVLGGGALCMELLTKQGWSSAYSMEAIILQISATLVKGKARICFTGNRGQYTFAKAQQAFRSLVSIHEKSGWYTPPQQDG